MTVELHPNDEYNQQLIQNLHPNEWTNPTPADKYNIVVIGAGSAGLITAAAAAGLGGKVALIEKYLMGGDCLNVGCVPSKAVIRSAKLFGDLKKARELGANIPEQTSADFAQVMARMRKIRAKISPDDSVWRYRDQLGVDVFLGAGKFVNDETIEVDGKQLHFKKAVIATGARARRIPIPGLEEAGYLINETVFELTEQPKRLAVIGGGPIGAELAQTFQRLGTQVTIFDFSSHLLAREDADAAEIVQSSLVNDGVQLCLEAKLQQVSTNANGKVLHFEQNGEEKTCEVDEILLAVGRQPNLEGLNLEAAGVEYTKRGVTVNDYLQTSNPRIFAAGDISMKYQFTHAADAAARIVVRNALFLGRQKVSDLVMPWCTYTDPEVAHVGMYPRDAEAAGIEIDTYTQPMEEIHRAVADGDEEGFVRIHVKKGTGTIVGATIVARHAGEMLNEITLAMVANIGLGKMAQVIHPYPTQAEAIKRVADAYNRTRLTSTAQKVTSTWLNWTK